MTFDGWPKTMLSFYSELEVNNTKDFWQANKEVYERDVRAPMEALVAELAVEFGEAKIFRPYRDVRFSKDKSPYKTEVSAVFHSSDLGGYYVRANADGLGAGGGYYRMAPDQLERFRQAMADDATGAELTELIAATQAQPGVEVHSETLKTAPRGWSKDHPRIDLLRRKNLTFMRQAPPGPTVHSRQALAFVRETFRHGAPLLGWLDKHVGASTEPAGRR